ncbi:XPG-I domain [Dillenia turbinata]|uniref:XPG-I domain n=1 Tax=Dillenia turbinata TaxID=194707 RepID=A0AAN8Z846_9MAGN
MMKEAEQETTNAHKTRVSEDVVNKKVSGVPRSLVNENQNSEASENTNSGNVNINDRNKEHNFENGGSFVVSFEVDGENKNFDGDDDLFAHLVAEDPEMISSGNNTPLRKHSIDSASDCDWEEGVIEESGHKFTGEAKDGSKLDTAEGSIFYESEVEWEEGTGDAAGDFVPRPDQSDRAVSKGSIEEEADLQEAIRRSLEDLRGDKIIDPLSVDGNRKNFQERTHEKNMVEVSRQEDEGLRLNFPVEDAVRQKASSLDIVDGVEMLRNVGGTESLGESLSFHGQLAESIAKDPDMKEVETNEPCNASPVSCAQLSNQSAMESIGIQQEEIPSVESVKSFAKPDGQFIENQLSDTNNGSSEAVPSGHYNKTTNFPVSHEGASVRETKTDGHVDFKIAKGTVSDVVSEDGENLDVAAVTEKEEIQDEAFKLNLEEEMRILDDECMNLGEEQRKLERNADSVNSEMFAECQELLQMFGLPYIIAPMEAEAQCAYMELANLVDGVVTDDSDVFLFGARSVYKNLFDDRKYVETYLMKDIESELGLPREKLIRMALLLGSDYTEGVRYMYCVSSVVVVNAFPDEDGLHKFREWVESPDPAILGKLDTRNGSSSRKRASKTADGDVNNSNDKVEKVFASDSDASQVNELNDSTDPIQSTKQIYMETHRNVSKNWHIPPSFPSEAVLSAYFSPQVDSSAEPFSWGKPDLFVLRRLCWEKFGWASQKADELLLPVLKEYDKHQTQLRLEAFYTFNERFAKIRSKRIKKAVKGITGSPSLKLMDDHVEEACKGRKKRGPNHSSEKDNETDELSGGNDMTSRGESNCPERTPKQSRKRKNHREPANTEAAEHDQTSNKLSRRSRNSGKGRGRGRGRGWKGGKGGRGDSPVFAEASSNRGGDSSNEQDMHLENSEAQHEVRRSTRLRKPVSYIVGDSGYVSESSDQNDEKESSLDEDLVQYAAGPSQLKNQSRYGDSLLFEGKESFDLGGGFCTSELEPESMVDRPDSNEHANPAFEDEISKEYLKMGGGFCLDEDETGKAQEDYGSVQASATILDHADFAHSSDENHAGNYAVQSGFSSKGTSDRLLDGGAHVTDIDQDENCSNVASKICHSADGMHLQNSIGHDSGTATEYTADNQTSGVRFSSSTLSFVFRIKTLYWAFLLWIIRSVPILDGAAGLASGKNFELDLRNSVVRPNPSAVSITELSELPQGTVSETSTRQRLHMCHTRGLMADDQANAISR